MRPRLGLYIILTFFLSGLVTSVNADGVNQTKIHIYGTILGPSCNVVNSDIAVDFGTIVDKGLYARRKTQSIPFSIEIEKCNLDFDHDAIVTFIGTESSAIDLQGFLALDPSSTASGIAVGIENAEGTFMPLRESSQAIPITSENTTLNFRAFVQAEESAVQNRSIGLGEFTATAIFVVEYE